MKLYELNSKCKVRLLEEAHTPAGSLLLPKGIVLQFYRVDGMYTSCKDSVGNTVYPAAWTEVEIVEDSA